MMHESEFKNRRQQIMRMIEDHSLVIIPSAPPKNRSRDIEYRYRQDSDFFYLTGFDEPNSILVLIPGRSEGEFILFSIKISPLMFLVQLPRTMRSYLDYKTQGMFLQ